MKGTELSSLLPPTIRVRAYVNGNPATIKNNVWIWKSTKGE